MGAYSISLNQDLNVKVEKVVTVALLVLLVISFPATVFADDPLTDIFSTKAFQGSWEVINKFDWVGRILSFVISAVSLLGLVSIMYQRVVTLLYLSSRNLFDTVYEVKQDSEGTAFFGFKGLADNVAKGNVGVGFDAVIGVFYSIIPNIRKYSDFNPERLQYGLKEDDNVVTYMLKTLLPTVLLVFFFSVGFNGTLARSYGVIVSGFSAGADRLVDTNLEVMVNKVFSAGETYTFTIGSNNSSEGKLAEDISRDIYGKVLSRLDVLDTETRMIVGQNVENVIWEDILDQSYGELARENLQRLLNSSIGGAVSLPVETDADVDALRYEVVVNTNTSTIGGATLAYRLMDFMPPGTQAANSTLENLTAHLILRKDRLAEADFFVRPGSNQNP